MRSCGWALIQIISILKRHHVSTEEKAMWGFMWGGLKERSHQEANQAPWSWIFQPLELQEINFCCLNQSLCFTSMASWFKIPHLPPGFQESSAAVSDGWVLVMSMWKGVNKRGNRLLLATLQIYPCQSDSSPLHTPVRSWTCKVEVSQTHSRWLSFNSW